MREFKGVRSYWIGIDSVFGLWFASLDESMSLSMLQVLCNFKIFLVLLVFSRGTGVMSSPVVGVDYAIARATVKTFFLSF